MIGGFRSREVAHISAVWSWRVPMARQHRQNNPNLCRVARRQHTCTMFEPDLTNAVTHESQMNISTSHTFYLPCLSSILSALTKAKAAIREALSNAMHAVYKASTRVS
jgi:hypothetical protein